jgi:hypothetical protein
LLFAYGALTRSGQPSQCCSAKRHDTFVCPTTPYAVAHGLGFSTFARHYSRNSLFSSGYLDVSVPPVPSPCGVTHSSWAGFPHSDTDGSMPAHGSPSLFAVYHVLLRLLTPRHPPSAFFHFFPAAENTPSFKIVLLLFWVSGFWFLVLSLYQQLITNNHPPTHQACFRCALIFNC